MGPWAYRALSFFNARGGAGPPRDPGRGASSGQVVQISHRPAMPTCRRRRRTQRIENATPIEVIMLGEAERTSIGEWAVLGSNQ
jgi:hypothetical protein